MNGNAKCVRDLNPVQNANFLSKITFFFVFPILRRGLKDFKERDVYEVTKRFSSKRLGNKLELEWEIERKKKRPSILKTIFRVFGYEYICWLILAVIVNTSMMFVKPSLIGKVVAYFRAKNSKEAALINATLLVGSIFVTTIFSRTYNFVLEQLSLRIKIACSTIIYRKVLKQNFGSKASQVGGQAVTLMTKDTLVLNNFLVIAPNGIVGIVQLIAMMYMMYTQIGLPTFAGVLVILLFVPAQAFLGAKSTKYRLLTASKTDERVQMTQEILSTIKVIKMYTWERFFCSTIDAVRKKEIRAFQMVANLKACCTAIGLINGKLALYASIVSFVILGNHITAEKAFVVTGCFAAVRVAISTHIPLTFVRAGEFKASLVRLNSYLRLEELAERPFTKNVNSSNILLNTVSVSYDDGPTILENINASFKPGITMVCGVIGSGKTVLLKAILGDIKATGTIEVPKRVSYASQEPWLFPGTVRQNIIFNEPFNEARYETVVRICALEKDFQTFEFRDRTVVADKGLNLSKGQKARINLARAVYKQSDCYLLDDCLSAIDVQVGKHIFYECMKKFLKDKICLLVSHQLAFLNEVDNIVLLSKGSLEFHGTYSDLKNMKNLENYFKDCNISNNIESSPYSKQEQMCNETEETDETSKLLLKSTKNIYQETNKEGGINKMVYLAYFSAGGIKLFLFVMFLTALRQATESWADYFVRFWVDSEQKLSDTKIKFQSNSTEYKEVQESHTSIMYQYSFVILSLLVLSIVKPVVAYIFSSRASINVHRLLMDKITSATMVFFDNNFAGNIINRFSRDFGVIDEQLPLAINECTRTLLSIVAILLVVSSVNTWFLIPALIFALLLYLGCRLYLASARNIRRIEGSTRSPVIGHLQATVDGITTIRASGAKDVVRDEFDVSHDVYNSTQFMHLAATNAFSYYMEIFTGFYVTIIIFSLLLFDRDTGAGEAGLAITQSFALTALIQWCLRQWTEFEIHMTSTERALQYTHIESENKKGSIIDNWPKRGKIVFKDVTLKYSKDGELILNNITFEIEPKQKIGIVGRTGAGKSSVVSTLFRLYAFDGTITVDDVDINAINLETLRSKISIIPQDPVLFSGSIRTNLDPGNQHSDEKLWSALKEVNMNADIESLDESLAENTNKFSIGQKQLICLARAIVQDNSILVLDEATSNVDGQTDALIQQTIQKLFVDKTIIIIAHRLHTIMECDKVLVMSSGQAVEYDEPKLLLKNEKSMFYAMVKGVDRT